MRIAPVSVLVAVTSAPGIAPPEESRTTPDSCEPAIACAHALPCVASTKHNDHDVTLETVSRCTPSRRHFCRGRDVSTRTGANQRSYRAVTVTLAFRSARGRNIQPLEWTPGAPRSSTPARRTSRVARTRRPRRSMQQATFTDLIFLLHHDRLPSPAERRLPGRHPDRVRRSRRRRAVMRGRPIWPRPAIDNRSPPAIAAGVLTIGDEHGGAGSRLHGADCGGAGTCRAVTASHSTDVAGAGSWTRPERRTRDCPASGIACTATIDPRVGGALRTRRRTRARRATASGSRARSRRAIRERLKPIPLNIDGALGGDSCSTSACRRWSASSCSSSGALPD